MKHFYQSIPGWFGFSAVYRDAVAHAPKARSVFVEVGAWKGKSSAFMAVEIANSRKPIDFYVVDHWLGSDEKPHKEDSDVQRGRLYHVFLRNTKSVSDYLKPLRMSSVEAATKFEDSSVDFCFLDGSHDYDSVKADLDAWLPKMKFGAVIAGDDWNWSGVQRSVNEAFALEKVQVLGEGKHRHWLVQL